MTHLTMDALLTLREPASEPGMAAAREHLENCPHCQAELGRLHQRVARLKALPSLRPPRDRWPLVATQLRAARRRRQVQAAGLAGLALAASLALVVYTRRSEPLAPAVAPVAAAPAVAEPAQRNELRLIIQQSRKLENVLSAYSADTRVIDGRTVQVQMVLEFKIAQVDQVLETVKQAQYQVREDQMLVLWRERVKLLGALVNTHATSANYVGY